MKVQEIITVKGWKEGSGWTYNQTIRAETIDIPEEDIKGPIDWDWYELNEEDTYENEDTEVKVEFYAEDAEIGQDEPLATHSIWASKLWEDRYGE